MDVVRVYACHGCGRSHPIENLALHCCRPRADLRWKCGVCMTVYYTKENAEACCKTGGGGNETEAR
jgi:hypothetical protein